MAFFILYGKTSEEILKRHFSNDSIYLQMVMPMQLWFITVLVFHLKTKD